MEVSDPLIAKTILFVKESLASAESGHDWWHISRVLSNAEAILPSLPLADSFTVRMAALLHDIDDWKFKDASNKSSKTKTEVFLESLALDQKIIQKILDVIESVSFKGSGVKDDTDSIEGKIVQDADRLDALGAIGIARCFSYGGFRQREMYNPEKKPCYHKTFEEYKGNNDGTTINHFYEKLLLLKDRMKTEKGKEIAKERHDYMQQFLERFLKEWEGKA